MAAMRSPFQRFFGRWFLTFALSCLAAAFSPTSAAAAERPPNVVLIFADDLGYGDPGCYGAKGWTTPHLDRLAREGVRFTRFYSAQPVCSASRAALLTGCYPNRVGIHGALGPRSKIGIHEDETTLAEVLKSRGYATAAFGKWHLGAAPKFLPARHGFDEYLGLPYSNDMWPNHPDLRNLSPEKRRERYPELPLIDGDRVVLPELTEAEQARLTTWYAQRAVKFIHENRDRPFFLYLAHSMPHVPLFVSERHKGKSERGIYGDVMEEIDWSVGEVLAALERHGLERNTLVIFTSDNGPWLSYGGHGGSAGPLREGKGTVWEGGVRVPFVARWPAAIPAGSETREPAMTIDLLPTLAKLAGAELPARKIDGLDILPLLTARPGAKTPREAFYFYYGNNELQAVMSGEWKLILPHAWRTLGGATARDDGLPVPYQQRKTERPELYNVETDPGESRDVAASHPDIVARLLKLAEKAREDLGDSLTGRKGANVREPGRIDG